MGYHPPGSEARQDGKADDCRAVTGGGGGFQEPVRTFFLIVFREGPARGRKRPARASRARIGRFSGPVLRTVRGASWIDAKLSLTGNFLDNLSVLYRADLIVFISPYE